MWPVTRELRTFKLWFDVEYHSVVGDFVDGELIDEE